MFSKDWIKPMKTKIDTFVKAHKLNCSTRSDSKAVCDCGFEEVLAENETIKEFIAKVSKMRTAQANWFRAHLQGDLREAKGWEKAVDKMLAYFLKEEPTETTAQGRLL